MGNRAVIVAKDTTAVNAGTKLGIYVHWRGGEENIISWLEKAKRLGIRNVNEDDSYFWARFCQIICDDFSEDDEHTLSVGINTVRNLDCHNYDNGVYYIDDNFEIVNHTSGEELLLNYNSAQYNFNLYKVSGSDCGGFIDKLLNAWNIADRENCERLAMGFPEYAYAIEKEHEKNK